MSADQQDLGIIVARDVMPPMCDGARLATDSYRPARDEPSLTAV